MPGGRPAPAGTPAALIFGKPARQYRVSTRMISRSTTTAATVKLAVSSPPAAPLPRFCTMLEFRSASRMPNFWSRSRMFGLFCRSVINCGHRGDEGADLVDDRRDDRVDRRADHHQQAEEDDSHPGPAPHAPLGDQVDQRIEPDGQQGRDGDQHQGVADGVQHQVADVGDQHAEAAEESPVERRSWSAPWISSWPSATACAACALAVAAAAAASLARTARSDIILAGHRADRGPQPRPAPVLLGVPLSRARREPSPDPAVAPIGVRREVELVERVVQRGLPPAPVGLGLGQRRVHRRPPQAGAADTARPGDSIGSPEPVAAGSVMRRDEIFVAGLVLVDPPGHVRAGRDHLDALRAGGVQH